MDRNARLKALHETLKQRIVFLDGAMGTMIQGYALDEKGYRGERFKDSEQDLKGNNDLLSLTQPQVIAEIHGAYLKAGADMIETNTFNSTSLSQADYQMQGLVRELNLASAHLPREYLWKNAKPIHRRLVLGCPTTIRRMAMRETARLLGATGDRRLSLLSQKDCLKSFLLLC